MALDYELENNFAVSDFVMNDNRVKKSFKLNILIVCYHQSIL